MPRDALRSNARDAPDYRPIRGLPVGTASLVTIIGRLGCVVSTDVLMSAMAREWPRLSTIQLKRVLFEALHEPRTLVVGEPVLRDINTEPTAYRLDVHRALWTPDRMERLLAKSAAASDSNAAELPASRATVGPTPRSTSLIKTAADRRRRAPLEWTIADTLPEYGVAQLVGPSYAGKTYVAIDIGLSICNESAGEWFGREIRRHGDAVFVLMEGAWDFQARLDAWLLAHPGTTDERLFTVEEPDDFDLTDEMSVAKLVREIHEADVRPAVLFIDTQSLAAASAEENSNSDMTKVFLALKYLSKRLNCIVIPLHHSGLTGEVRARGASSQFASADVQLVLSRGTLHAVKIKAYKPWDQPEGFEICPMGESAYVRPRALLPALADASAVARADLKRRVLEVIIERAGLTMTQLGERVGGNHGARGDAVNDLIDDGLVREERGKRNARHLHPTDKALSRGEAG